MTRPERSSAGATYAIPRSSMTHTAPSQHLQPHSQTAPALITALAVISSGKSISPLRTGLPPTPHSEPGCMQLAYYPTGTTVLSSTPQLPHARLPKTGQRGRHWLRLRLLLPPSSPRPQLTLPGPALLTGTDQNPPPQLPPSLQQKRLTPRPSLILSWAGPLSAPRMRPPSPSNTRPTQTCSKYLGPTHLLAQARDYRHLPAHRPPHLPAEKKMTLTRDRAIRRLAKPKPVVRQAPQLMHLLLQPTTRQLLRELLPHSKPPLSPSLTQIVKHWMKKMTPPHSPTVSTQLLMTTSRILRTQPTWRKTLLLLPHPPYPLALELWPPPPWLPRRPPMGGKPLVALLAPSHLPPPHH